VVNGIQSSPVDVAVSIRKELAEFQRTTTKEAWIETLREACKEALLQSAVPLDAGPVIEYIEERRLVRDARRAAQRLHRRHLRQLRLAAPAPARSPSMSPLLRLLIGSGAGRTSGADSTLNSSAFAPASGPAIMSDAR